MRLFYLALLTSIVLLSCKKDNPDSQCDYNIQDSSVLANKLSGSWKWIKTRSGGTGEIFQADTLRILTFRPDSTFSYVEGTTTLAQGKWSLKFVSRPFIWGLSLDPWSDYGLMGSVVICNNQINQMVLFNSDLDGPDIFYERLN